MIILPAIDLSGGQVVRLTKGDYGKKDVYASDPAEIARGFASSGAAYLHVVDLDGAKDGSLSNFDAVKAIADVGGLYMEIGGGIRDMGRTEKYLSLGVGRCILGTAAVNDPAFLRSAVFEFGERVAVGVDARDGMVAVSGWLETTNLRGIDFCRELIEIGVKTVIYTDISRDGMLSGPNHELYAELSGLEGLNVIASGGVTSVDDVRRLAKTGIHGAIIGKALYTGKIKIEEALEAAAC